MHKKEISEILKDSWEFARLFLTAELFDGFTETEITKGAAAVFIMLDMIEQSDINPPFDTVSDTLRTNGIMDSEWDRSSKVSKIITKILCTGEKDGAAQ